MDDQDKEGAAVVAVMVLFGVAIGALLMTLVGG